MESTASPVEENRRRKITNQEAVIRWMDRSVNEASEALFQSLAAWLEDSWGSASLHPRLS